MNNRAHDVAVAVALAVAGTFAWSTAGQVLPPTGTGVTTTVIPVESPATAPATMPVGVMREDLTNCRLTHGELDLPLPLAQGAGKGYIVRLSDEARAVLPKVEPGKTDKDIMELMRKERTGDLFYTARSEGSLVVISGKAMDLGSKYLYEMSDQPSPLPRETGVEPGKPNQVAGRLPAVKEGNTYLIECADGKYALVRVLRKSHDVVRIQYVYQADGTNVFTVPKGALSPAPAVLPVAATTLPGTPTLTSVNVQPVTLIPPVTLPKPEPVISLAPSVAPDATDRVLEPYLETYLLQRRKMIERRVLTVRVQARTEREIRAKTEAIEELGKLNAAEAVDTLISEISFQNTLAKPRHFTPEAFHPAVGVLRQLGKPASQAALRTIAALRPDAVPAPEDPLQTTEYRLHLLTLVIKGIEGADTAEYLLTRDMQKADSAAKPLYEQALKYLREP